MPPRNPAPRRAKAQKRERQPQTGHFHALQIASCGEKKFKAGWRLGGCKKARAEGACNMWWTCCNNVEEWKAVTCWTLFAAGSGREGKEGVERRRVKGDGGTDGLTRLLLVVLGV